MSDTQAPQAIFMSIGQRVGAQVSKTRLDARRTLAAALFAAAIWPPLMIYFSNSLQAVSSRISEDLFFSCGTLVVLVFAWPVILTSTAMPLLFKGSVQNASQAGSHLGRLASVNSLGSVFGALFVTFISFGPLELGLEHFFFYLSAWLQVRSHCFQRPQGSERLAPSSSSPWYSFSCLTIDRSIE